MFRQNLVLSLITCLVAFMLSGCGENTKQPLINFTAFPSASNDKPEDQKYEVIRLSNGVVVYKDRSVDKKSSDDQPSNNNNFGPQTINFDPNPVKFKN